MVQDLVVPSDSSSDSDPEPNQGAPSSNGSDVPPFNDLVASTSEDIGIEDPDYSEAGVEHFNSLDYPSPQPPSSESEDDATEECEDANVRCTTRLADWAARAHDDGLAQLKINELLDILIEVGIPLPKDCRTLLKTPRRINTRRLCGGDYIYFGLELGIKQYYSMNPAGCNSNRPLQLLVNVDGTPLFKSTNHQFWPILVSCNGCQPFVVALYYGVRKPSPVEEFMQDFLEELQTLETHGISFDGSIQPWPLQLKGFVCDTPARAFLKCVKGHSGKYSCERCEIEGYRKSNRIIFLPQPQDNLALRTDAAFMNMNYLGTHQHAKSPLIDYGIPCVSAFCLDYMHLVCLGIVRRILNFMKDGPAVCRLSHKQLDLLSRHLVSFSGSMPSEFARQPRSLFDVSRWKATEFRQFLLYTGPIVLKDILSRKAYTHFMSLSVSVSILLDENNDKRGRYLQYARELLEYFVDNAQDLYSEIFVVFNVHSLKHLADDCEHFNCSLNDISAFPFENHLQLIKKKVRSAKNPIVQVSKRLRELEFCTLKKKSKCHKISTRQRDSCFLLTNDSLAFVKECRKEVFVCEIVRFDQTENFFTEPCHSKLFNIMYISRMPRNTRTRLVERRELLRKVVALPYKDGIVVFPVLHDMK